MVSTRRSGRAGADGAEPSTSGLSAPLEQQEPGSVSKRRAGSRVTASPASATRTRVGRSKTADGELVPVPEETPGTASEQDEQPGPSQTLASPSRLARGGLPRAGKTTASQTPQLASATQPEEAGTTASAVAPQETVATTTASPAALPAKGRKAQAATPTTAAAAAAAAAGAAAATTTSPAAKGPAAAPKQAAPAAETKKAAAAHATAQAAAARDEWDFSTDDDEDEEVAAGGALSKLAASIRAALQAKSGKAAPAPRKAASMAAHEEVQVSGAATGELTAEAATLRWQPQVEVAAPTKEPTREVLKMNVEADKEKGLAKQLLVPPRDPRVLSKIGKDAKPDTAGKKWFDLPSQKIDADMKRELRLLRLRGAYDTKRFYKSFDNTKFPKYFAMGTVVEGPTEFYSGRLEAKQRRKASLTDQLLADAELHSTRKKRYSKLQEEASKYQRVKKRKTDNARDVKRKPRPQH